MADRDRHAGRVALVTGAGSAQGIGFAVATLLGRGGARVAVTSTTERIHERAAELAAEGVEAAGFVADLTDHGQARELAAEVAVRLGAVDILVNNAGIAQLGEHSSLVPFVEITEQQWDRDIAVNLKTAFNITRAVLPGMVERGWGRVISVSSVTGPVVSYPGNSGYSAAKGAIDGLTRALAIETGSSDDAEREGGRNTPVGRSGTPFEVAELIAFLATDGARYLTGRSIVVDGGNTIQEFKGS